jgi:hypothetical protein
MRARSLGVLLFALAAVLTACGREQGAQAQQLDVVATDFKFDGVSEQITGGEIELTFRNDGKADHEIGFLQIGDTNPQTLSKAIAGFDEGAPFPEWFGSGAIPGEIEPGKTLSTTFTLPPGEYTLACTLTDAPGGGEKEVASHATLGMFQRVTVEGGEDAALDAPNGEFVARDYTFDVPETLDAGKREYVFRNGSTKQYHHMILNEFPAGTTPDQATKATATMFSLEEGQAPPAGTPEPKEAGFTGIFSPGLGQTVELNLKADRTYVAMCFIHDIAGGPPHAIAHKMYKAFTT